MRRWTLSLGMGGALVACLAIGGAGSARAATLDFTGTLSLQMGSNTQYAPPLIINATGAALVNASATGVHLISLGLAGGTFGPVTTSVQTTSLSFPRERFTGLDNLSGNFSATTGGGWGGPMGLTGLARLCLTFGGWSCSSYIPIPIAATTNAGFGIGGTVTTTAFTGGLSVTMQNAPWTIGQPVMTIHTPNSTISTRPLPGGFAHGPASLTSSTAQPSGALQLVTVSKVFTTLTDAFPEFEVTGVLSLHFVPEPGTLLLLGLGVAGLAAYGRGTRRR